MNDNYALIISCSVFAVICLSFYYFEKSNMGTKEIALIATLSAFAAICRIPFVVVPNIQPTTFIVSISGYIFGPFAGFLVGSTAAFTSNIFLGQGPWTPWQMFSWGLVGTISGVIGRKYKNISVVKYSLICFSFGFMFDWIMNLWHVLGFIKPLNINTIILAYLTGLTFDIMHACGNFVFSMIFYEKFRNILLRFNHKLHITYVNNKG